MSIFYYTLFGDGLYFIPEIMKEGEKVITYIDEKGYKRLSDGIIDKRESLTTWMSEITKEDTVVFDYNTKNGVDICKKLKSKGITNIIGGTKFAYDLEHNRAFAMRMLAQNGVLIPDTFVINSNAEGVKFIKQNEGRYVYKPDGEDCASEETYVSENGKDMIDFINARPNQTFILQKFIEDAICEIGIECYFSKGKLVKGISHTIETKRYGVGKDGIGRGPNTGCMSSVCWFSDEEEQGKIFQKTWAKGLHVFEEQEYTGACDISGIIDKKGDFYALELTPRFGYSQDITLYRLLKMPISTFWKGLANGTITEISIDLTKYACSARGSIPPYPLEQRKPFEAQVKEIISDTVNTPVIWKPHADVKYHWIDVKKNKQGELITAGIDAIICEVTTTGKDLKITQDVVISAMDDIQLGGFYFREDMFVAAINQIPKLKSIGLFDNKNL